MGGGSRTSDWMSYDSVAQLYQRVAVPLFSPIATDLIAAVRLTSGETLLDLGTGTGLVAEVACGAVAPSGFVVGLDPSIGMLELVTPADRLALVAAQAPGLPFADAVFDAVTANLVISHLPDLHAGLRDIARVLRPGGRLGCTAWG
jgi:arsenite methyltransferase